MRRGILIALAAGLIAGLAACETQEHADAELDGVRKAKAAAARASAHTNVGLADEIGIAECDDYIKKFEACLAEKIPADDQIKFRMTLDDQKRQWRSVANDPAQHDTLVQQCTDAANMAKSTMQECSF